MYKKTKKTMTNSRAGAASNEEVKDENKCFEMWNENHEDEKTAIIAGAGEHLCGIGNGIIDLFYSYQENEPKMIRDDSYWDALWLNSVAIWKDKLLAEETAILTKKINDYTLKVMIDETSFVGNEEDFKKGYHYDKF